MQNSFWINRYVDLNVLQKIQESFSTATGLASVFADEQGNHIGSGSNFSNLCNKIRSHPEGCASCRLSNFKASIIARRQRKPFIYKCHAGLIDMVVPIIVDSKCVGMMLAGQIKCVDADFPEVIKKPQKVNWYINPEFQQMYSEIETLPTKKIEAAANSLFVLVNYIVEKCIAESTQIKLNKQNQKLMHEIEMRHKLEESLKTAELKALQHKINPHFMFNVLNTVSRLIGLQEFNTAQAVLDTFTKMLRYSISDFDKVVTLEKELDYVEKYLYLQNIRFGSRIKYTIQVDPKLLHIEIPFFTLQPLVENAIIHGLEPKEEGGQILIVGHIGPDKNIFTIMDDGLGIPAKNLETIRGLAEAKTNSNFDSRIGIKNVIDRLVLFWGDSFHFEISSTINEGTTITLTFSHKLTLTNKSKV
ncbi:MAG: PocR ligand-binding domain-containing protein [Dehalobacterium sp.]